jgi:transcriptional regulator with XRE-family HTH domain
MPNKLNSKVPKRTFGKPAAGARPSRGDSLAKISAQPGVSESAPGMELGAAIRRRRKDMDLTLAQVSARCGFTTGYLSQLERDLATPSLLALAGISRALGVELDYFLGARHERGHHFPLSSRDFFSLGRQGMQYARISGEFPAHTLNAMLVKVPPHYASPEPMTLEGEELVYVVEGRLLYSMGERQFDLKPGDVVHLPSNIPHRWENPSDEEGSVLWVGTDRIFSFAPREDAAPVKGKKA